MYLEPNKCAQCGKVLHESAAHVPHNAELRKLTSSHPYTPLFCSPRCIHEAAASAVPKETLERLQNDFDKATKYIDYTGDIWRSVSLRSWWDQRDDARKYGWHYDPDEEFNEKAAIVEGKQRAREQAAKAKTDYEAALRDAQKDTLPLFFANYAAARATYEASKPVEKPPIAPVITDAMRFEHTHILGPTGSGKTTLIQQLVMKDFTVHDPPAIIIIDPKGRMVGNIARLSYLLAGDANNIPLARRLVIIDPTHNPPPPLNLFRRTGSVAGINYAINNFDYLFAQAGSELTSMMRPLFRFCARLMFSIPDADIFTLLEFLESKPNDPRFQPYIDSLTDIGAKRFFTKDFAAETYRGTRDQVRRRFNDILSMPEILASFTSPSPPLDMEKCLQERKIVLVHTCLTALGPMESQIFGRNMINLTLGAAFARGTDGPPAFLYIDEFQDFVDEQQTAKQFRLAREYNLGIIAAHQNMFCNELNESLRSAISGNTAIKYCAKAYGYDRSYMLKDLGCDENFLDAQVTDREQQLVKFACVVKGHPPSSVSLKYPNITPKLQMPHHVFEGILQKKIAQLHPPKTHKPPPEEGGLRANFNMPAEADTSSIPPPDSPKPQFTQKKDDDTDNAAEWSP